jgi:exopolysaccharide biosynthesis polyprenyl glycosylphosphotransferase
MANSRNTLSRLVIFLPDLVILYASLFLAIRLRYPQGLAYSQRLGHIQAFSVIFIFWLVVFFVHGLFDARSFRRYTALIFNLVSAMAVNTLVAITYFYFQPNLILTPRRFLLIEVVVTLVLLVAWNLFVKYLLKNRVLEGVYLFSFEHELDELENEIRNHAFLGYRLLGKLNEQTLANPHIEPNSAIILPDSLRSSPQTSERLYQLRTRGVNFYNHKDFYESLMRRVYLSELSEIWFLENIDYREKRFYNLMKRIIDIMVGLLAGVVFAGTSPVIALLIKLTSKGPVLFIQERVGKGGKLFKVYKYRTMAAGNPTNTWTSVNDPRITKFGRFLRKSRIDEWPQFINLLIGNMSLVGPRPEQPHIVEKLKMEIPFYDERHLVKPGLTGWAQINNIYAGNVEETKLKLQYDLYYIKHRSFLFDMEIVLKTLYYIFTWQGR